MNVISRGVRGAVRSPLKASAIIIMLAISIALIVGMLATRAGVENKINEIKANAATGITIRPAGVMGLMGGGEPLTAEQVKTVTETDHIKSVSMSLTDQLGESDTDLEPSLEAGSIGKRIQRFDGSGAPTISYISPNGERSSTPPPPRTAVTGTTDPNSVVTGGGELTIKEGSTIDGKSGLYEALVGTDLAKRNNLEVGDIFTAYDQKFTVKGIFETGTKFQDSSVIIPLRTLQTLTDQEDAVTQMIATVDSSDNVATVVSSLESSLGDEADITSDKERAEESVVSLASISSLATGGVIGATIAAGVIVLLTMTMIVRERRREIGVIKAIGGTNTKVILQFITEALTLTIIGGLIGIAMGILVSGSITQNLVANQADQPPQPQMRRGGDGGLQGGPMMLRNVDQGVKNITSSVGTDVIAGGIGLTLFIAIIGSAIPAWSIARIRPAEVLRTE